MSVLKSAPNILKDPAPEVAVVTLADSSVNLVCRPWCLPEHYWEVYFDVTEKVKLALDEADISIPYPHQEVFMHQAA